MQSHIDCIIHSPVCLVGKLQGLQLGSCDVLQVIQHHCLKGFNDHRHQEDGPIVIQPCEGGLLGDRDDGEAPEAGGNLT